MLYPSDNSYPSDVVFPGTSTDYRFTPPFVQHDFRISGALRATYKYGLTVMRIDGQWVTTEFPSWEQEQSADLFFRGGYIHTIDEVAAADLSAAGFEVEPL
jgi:hypothetical protein